MKHANLFPQSSVNPALLLILFLLAPLQSVHARDSSILPVEENGEQAEDTVHEFVMALLPSRIELNPLYTYSSLEAQLYTALYEGLVSYDPYSLRPIAGAAERWEILEEGLLYRFHLREDAYYWNGDAVLSSHFRDAWLAMLSLGDDAPFSFLLDPILNAPEFRRGEIQDAMEVGITAPDDRILEVRLSRPASHFLSILAHQSLVPIHPDALGLADWSSMSSPLGNGPYYILSRDESRIVMTRNELYWDRQNSEFEKIVIEFHQDPTGTSQRFNSGEIHWVYSGFDFRQIRVPDSIQIAPQFATSYYFFSARQKPFDDPEVRKALLSLLPLDEIRSSAVHYIPTRTLVPQIPGYPEIDGLQELEREDALRVLDEAGYPDGQGLPTVRLVLTDDNESRRVAGLISEAWSVLEGMRIESEFVSFEDHQDTMRSGDFTLGSISWIGDYADPLSFLQMWTAESSMNLSAFVDESYEKLIDQTYSVASLQRYQALAEAEQYLLESAIVLPVSHSPSLNLINLESIGGWYPNPLGIHPFKYLFLNRLVPPANVTSLPRGPGQP